MYGHDSAVHPDVRIALPDHRCIGAGICLVCKTVKEWQRAEGGRTWTLSREDRARLAVAIMKAAEDAGNPITQVHVARMLNVHKSQISRDIRDLIPDSEGRNAFDRRRIEGASHGGARQKRKDVERVAMMRQDLGTILAQRLTSTDDEMRLILSDAMVEEIRALRDLCNTALVGAGMLS
ncbi:hypothetical protein [Micromonospora inositola]|uniref:Helix-turn-helix domain-containing protein n=1 Tax=Micromonospora inositola TaxID=47865 RepID=A0A1C5JQ65_9ACTN|nr:hypothetical protein [Micromonospora inositola]SCG72481.1 hypothetical protein GA0070613_5089 [Micromonospora inositola]